MVQWIRVKGCTEFPSVYETVLLHTPQWDMAEGEVTTGSWTGSEWEASDGRVWDGALPVHWARVEPPTFKGDEDEWPDGEFDDDF